MAGNDKAKKLRGLSGYFGVVLVGIERSDSFDLGWKTKISEKSLEATPNLEDMELEEESLEVTQTGENVTPEEDKLL